MFQEEGVSASNASSFQRPPVRRRSPQSSAKRPVRFAPDILVAAGISPTKDVKSSVTESSKIVVGEAKEPVVEEVETVSALHGFTPTEMPVLETLVETPVSEAVEAAEKKGNFLFSVGDHVFFEGKLWVIDGTSVDGKHILSRIRLGGLEKDIKTVEAKVLEREQLKRVGEAPEQVFSLFHIGQELRFSLNGHDAKFKVGKKSGLKLIGTLTIEGTPFPTVLRGQKLDLNTVCGYLLSN